jgi:hypothetical protein
LVFNPGEFVEGFSSPFWIIYLGLIRLTGLTYWGIIRLTGVFSYLIFWLILVITNRKLSGISDKSAINIPLIYLTFSYSVLTYFTSGTETPLVLVYAGLYACFILFPESRFLQVFIGISPLVRHEMLLPFALLVIWRFFAGKRIPWVLVVSCLISLGSWIVFRVVYYADFLPNTFYLKDEVSLLQGILYVLDTLLPYFAIPFLLVFFIVFSLLRKKEGNETLLQKERLLMLAAALLITLYVVKIGGDSRHFRFLAFPYCLVMISTGGLIERIFSHIRYRSRYLYAIGFTLAVATFFCYPRQLLNHPILGKDYFEHRQYLKINDAAVFRVHEKLPSLFSSGNEIEMKEEKKLWAREFKTITKENVFTTGTCYEAFKNFDSYVINYFGLTDAFLARSSMPSLLPGHKYGLIPFAEELVNVREKYGFRRGAFRRMVLAKDAPEWIELNLEKLEVIERKVYNTQNFWENFSLALKPVPKIKVSDG